MLIKKMKLDTVTFDGSQAENYMYPDTAYGDDVEVAITHHHKEDVDRSITVKIGDMMFLPQQLKDVLDQVEKYKLAAKHFV